MIPLFAIVRIETPGADPVRLWLPLILVWILLAPFVLVLLPLLLVAAAVYGMSPFATLAALGGLLAALNDVHVEVQSPDASVLVKLY